MGFGIILGAANQGYEQARKADDAHKLAQAQQDEAAFQKNQRDRLIKAQNMPVVQPGAQVADDGAVTISPVEIQSQLGLDPKEWAAVQAQGADAVNAYLRGHAAANAPAPAAPAPTGGALPIGSGAPSPAAAPAAPAIPAGGAIPAAPAPAPAPQVAEAPYRAVQTSTGLRFTNKTRTATTDDQLMSRAANYMAMGLDDRAIPLMQFAMNNKMNALKLDQMENQARYQKTWEAANNAALTGNWKQLETSVNKEFANTGTHVQVSADAQGTVRIDTVDNTTKQVLGSSMLSTDPDKNPNGLPDLQGFIASMKDPQTAIAYRQHLATMHYQNAMVDNARKQVANQATQIANEHQYQLGSLANQRSEIGVRAMEAKAQTATSQALAGLYGAEAQKQKILTGLQQTIANPHAAPQDRLNAVQQLREISGQPPLATTFSQPVMPNSVATDALGNQSMVVPIGHGSSARNMTVPLPVAGNHTMLSDPYVANGKVTPAWGQDAQGKPVVMYQPAGSPVGLPTLEAAKAAYDQAHAVPGATKGAIPAEAAPPTAAAAPGAVSGWGQLPQAAGAVGGFIANAARDAGQVDDNSYFNGQ